MLQKLICHFSIKMLKIFCLRDTPSAWAQSHGSLDHNENSQIVVNQRIAAWPTLRSFAITIRPCPWSLWELGNNTDQGSILVPEKMGSAFKVFQNSAIWNSPKPLVVCFKLIKGLRKEEVNFQNKTCHQCYLLSSMWVYIFQYSKQFAEKKLPHCSHQKQKRQNFSSLWPSYKFPTPQTLDGQCPLHISIKGLISCINTMLMSE